MTTLADPGQASGTPQPPRPEPADAPDRGAADRAGLSQRAQAAMAVTILLGLVLGFIVYLFGLSALSEQHAQSTLRKSFADALSKAVAPLGPVAPGTPIAALSIPRIGLDQVVVVEGTGAHELTRGPGHRRDTVLPGQAGVCAIYGRRTAFGAPFADLMQLQIGDLVFATTGQGVARYRVSSFGDSQHPAPANSANRLVLATADASLVPHKILTVSADLVSKPQPSSGSLPVIGEDEASLSGDGASSIFAVVLWSQALLLLAIFVPVLALRWSPVATYICAAPITVAVLWNVYQNVALMLPNLY